MITELRSLLKSHVWRAFLWIFLGVLIFGGLSFDFSDNKPWVIKVYKEKSTELDFRQAIVSLQRYLDSLKAQGIVFPRTESIEKEVLRRIVANALLQNVGKELDLAIPQMLLDEQLSQYFVSFPAYFFDAKGQPNIDKIEKLIQRPFDSFIQEIENEIKSNLLYSLISIGSYIPQFEVSAQYTEECADKTYSILTFSLHKALEKAKETKVSQEVLERFYKKAEHGDVYKSVEKRAGHYWKFSSKDYGLTVSKADVSAYYDAHKQADYLEHPAEVQVHRIFFKVDGDNDARAEAHIVQEELQKDPTAFAATAKKIAAAKLASQGSEKTEFFAKDSKKYDKILVDTAFEQLSQDHDISNVIKTEKGYEILQRLSRKPAKYTSLHEVQGHIEEKLLEEKFAKRFKQDAERLVSHAGYNKEALASFIEKRKGHKESLDLEVKNPGIIGMQLFQTEQGHYAVFMMGKEGILLECTHVQKRALKPFAEIKSTVSADYYKKQAQQELQTIALDAMKNASTMSFDDLAKKYDAHVQVAHATYKNGQMDQDAILRRPEIMQKLNVLQSAGAMIDVATATESFLIRLDVVAQVDNKLFEEKKTTIESTLASKAKYKGRDSFIASLYIHAKLIDKMIEIKEQLLKDTKDTLL
ncbi:MAG: peptidyl-prolyl cis-trans isomerase [Candidatus Chromulinivorax sp.]|nr:peptidyl-prolyl cis-trans isomerase [Candidatus Chromulinivorax sp.]